MRLATILEDEGSWVAAIRGDRYLPLSDGAPVPHASIRDIAGSSPDDLRRLDAWIAAQPSGSFHPLHDLRIGPVIPDPGAIYTIGLNYDGPGASPRPERPLVYGKAATSVAGDGATLAWDRTVAPTVDAEIELGVVIGATAMDVPLEDALDHVFGFTCINDVSSRDAWLDGDQWLLGKSFPGFCPVGPWVVTRDEFDPADVRLGCTIDGEAIQDGSTADMRFGVAEIVSFLSRHLTLRPGDLIASGTPVRLAEPPGPDRHLEPGDHVTVWIEGIGELSTTIARTQTRRTEP